MKLTVAIPTIAGREKYLHASLKTCVSQDVDELEILVSDNSAERGAQAVVEQFDDSRIRYISPPAYVPMAKHWDFVVANVSGDAFTIIGDDDGLMPGCAQRVLDLLKQHGLCPIHHSLCNYFWPDFSDKTRRNRIHFSHTSDGLTTVVDGDGMFRKLCQAKARYFDGPMVYHNFIPTALVRSLTHDGVFFRRAAPDVYSSVALSAACSSYLSTSEYLTLSGQSSQSTGNAVRLGTKVGQAYMTEMQADFRPRFMSQTVQFALLDAIYEVVETYNRSDMLDDINVAAHLYRAVMEVRSIVGADKKVKELSRLGLTALKNKVMTKTTAYLAERVLRRMGKTSSKIAIYHAPSSVTCDASVTDIYAASMFLYSYLNGTSTVARAGDQLPVMAAGSCHTSL